LGKELINQKEYKLAYECFDEAVLLDSEDAYAYAFRAKANFYLGRYEQTLEDAKKSIEIYPNDRGFGMIGSAKLLLGDNAGAIEYMTKALELNPEYMKCYEVRARAEANIGDYISSLKDVYKAINLKDDYAKSYEVLAYAQIGIKDYPSALESFEKSAMLFKKNGDRKNYKLMKKRIKETKRLLK
jgi:serine/threonine-protein kinase